MGIKKTEFISRLVALVILWVKCILSSKNQLLYMLHDTESAVSSASKVRLTDRHLYFSVLLPFVVLQLITSTLNAGDHGSYLYELLNATYSGLLILVLPYLLAEILSQSANEFRLSISHNSAFNLIGISILPILFSQAIPSCLGAVSLVLWIMAWGLSTYFFSCGIPKFLAAENECSFPPGKSKIISILFLILTWGILNVAQLIRFSVESYVQPPSLGQIEAVQPDINESPKFSAVDCNRFTSYDEIISFVRGRYPREDFIGTSSWIRMSEFYLAKDGFGYLIISTDDRPYIHAGVPIQLWQKLKESESIGSFYNTQLKGKYACHPNSSQSPSITPSVQDTIQFCKGAWTNKPCK